DRQQDELRRDREALDAQKLQQDEVQRALDAKLRDAELVQVELGFLKDDQESRQKAAQEQQSLLDTTLEELHRQKEEITTAESRLAEREAELDARANETAEQAATLKSKLLQALELQERLEADRQAVREREAALAEAEGARSAFQEQLRRRAED